MSELFCDRLLEAIDARGAPICAGIDPVFERLPAPVAARVAAPQESDPRPMVDAIFDFTIRVLRRIAPHVPCVKFQSAYFEQHGPEGVEAYFSLLQEAIELGLLVIGDVKRGDIGTTAAAYAAGHLADHSGDEQEEFRTPHAITVNPFCGLDTLAPFIDTARQYDKGLFVLVRTSNPGSAQLQDVKLAEGSTWSEHLADQLRPLTEEAGLVGRYGYSSVGAVVGATQPHTMESLRRRLPKSIFLLPGYGAQGATADMTRAAFVEGRGAIISASRSILYAHSNPKYADQFGQDWERCVEQAVLDMKQDVANMLLGT